MSSGEPLLHVSSLPSTDAAPLHQVLNAMFGCAVVQLDLNERITGWNVAAEQLFGYPADEVLGHNVHELFDSEERRQTGEHSWAQRNGHYQTSAWRKTKGGARIAVDVTVGCIYADDNTPRGYVEVARPSQENAISGWTRRSTNQSVEQPRLIFGPNQDATFLIDSLGAILDANPTAVSLLGCPPEELLGENLEAFVPVSQMFTLQEQYWSEDPTTASRVVILCTRKDGSSFPAEVNITAVEMGDVSVQIVGVRDVTQQRIAEAERDRLLRVVESASDFIGIADQHGNILYQNPAANRALGRPEHASTEGLHVSQVHPPWVAKQLLEHAIPTALRDGSCTQESVLLGVDGLEIPISQLITVHRNEAGEVEYLSAIMRDLRSQRRAEALLAKVAAQVQGMLYQFELLPTGQMHFHYVSPGVYELYGVRPDTLARDARSMSDRILPEDLGPLGATIRASAQNLSPCIVEYRVRDANGAIRWHQGRSVPERTPEGSVLWHGFIWDATDARIAADELQRRQVELEDAIAALDAGFAMFDADERLIVCNDRYAQLYHVPHELREARPTFEALLRTAFARNAEQGKWVPPGVDSEQWIEQRLAEFRSPQGASLQRHGERWIRVDEHKTANGGTVSTRTDVTAIKQAEFEATLQQERLKLATAAAGIGIWEMEISTGALIWDARMLQQHDFQFDEFPGTYQGWRSRIHPDDLNHVEQQLHDAVMHGKDFRAVFRVVHRDGTMRHLESRSGCIRGADGAIVRVIGVSLDITDQVVFQETLQRTAKAAQAASKAKAEFLATMSHEIRTPMNGVIGMTNLLIRTNLDGVQREYVETIRASGESLLTLINDILDFSKMEAGKLQLEKVPFSIEQAVMESITLFTSQAEAKGVMLVPRLPQTAIRVIGDPTRFKQILLNLVSNALKFTKEGSVTISVNPTPLSPEVITLEVRVTDTGIGISPEHLRRLGEAFLQADASTTRQYGGTGLGLSICRSLIQLMNGTMSVESELGKGTTFVVRFPFGVAPVPDRLEEAPAPSRPTLVQMARVLVAEDNVVNQRVVGLMLKKLARQIDFAKDGKEALGLFMKHDYDCVLMDGQMPEMDGLEATRRIRVYERETGRRHTPIVALTANALPGDREAFLGAGMDEYLTKPIRVGDLEVTLARVQASFPSTPLKPFQEQ